MNVYTTVPAKDLIKGMQIKTGHGEKTVEKVSTIVNSRSLRIAFADGQIVLCPINSKYRRRTTS